jgi:allantoinase
VQATLAVLLECGHHTRGLPLAQIASLLSLRPATRFGLDRKGAIRVGLDADVTLVALHEVHAFDNLLQRHPISPYHGMSGRGVVRSTMRRGDTIFAGGSTTARTRGTLVTCTR